MTRWIGAAVLALALMSGGAPAVDPAAAATLQAEAQNPETSKVTKVSARRRIRHPAQYADRTDDRFYYYDRPTTYRPYPYVSPVPFFLGIGFGPWW
jgi:hypothetical protein